ncbi:hypothetical protein [Ruminococcus sp.]|uniref:XAC2610-related protein n=1 Tax=Ruminococcus sp. TaxID=41978 RepID=UPI002CBBAB30|nr:hypothetical protein [Ruminococcus sp.]HNZ99071.1 hypothetical protein [Ruminococcus sp.]HOH85951.1 hypothetical protein [Ruminococcus sp.]
MKKHYIVPIFTAALLMGCSESRTSLSSAPADETTAAETTITEPDTTKPIVTESAPSDSKERRGRKEKVTVGLSGTTLTVLQGGSKVGTIELDEPPVYGTDDVVTEDVNFDGYDDIFVYDSLETGTYWLYDPEKEEFTKSDAFALFDGKTYHLTASSYFKTLTLEGQSGSDIAEIRYKWKGDKLVPERLTLEYRIYGVERKRLRDTYEFDEEGRKLLVERKHINFETGDWLKTETDLTYLRAAENSVDYMKGRELIQSIDVSGLPQLYERIKQNGKENSLPYSSYNFDDSADVFLIENDYDFDGYNDLQIQTDSVLAGGSDKYVYYRYDAEKDRYTEWQELNDFGCYIGANSQTQTIQYYDKHSLDEDHNCYIFKWDNGRLRLKEREFYHGVGNDCDIYEYDEDGNEHYVRTGKYVKDDC